MCTHMYPLGSGVNTAMLRLSAWGAPGVQLCQQGYCPPPGWSLGHTGSVGAGPPSWLPGNMVAVLTGLGGGSWGPVGSPH